MALKVSKVDVWAATIRDRAGGLAAVLAPLAKAETNFDAVLARRTPEKKGRGVVFVTPIRSARQKAAARRAGFKPAKHHLGLRVDGVDKPGLCAKVAAAIGAAGVSLRGLNAQATGNRCSMYLGFDSPSDAAKAAKALRKL